jgi:tetratricopeptide (TPR) repeat protein
MNSRDCSFGKLVAELTLVFAFLAPAALAQRPPAPAPQPPPANPPPGSPSTPTRPNPSPLDPLNVQPSGDLIMFLTGRVKTTDGTALPSNTVVERICNARTRQQVYASPNGSFSMQLGSTTGTVVDASAEGGSMPWDRSSGRLNQQGIPRTELANCELRASVSGFRSDVLNLFARDSFGGNMDVGDLAVQRLEKINGMTISAAAYNAPKDARKAYEKGVEAVRAGNSAIARQQFEKAVQIYPKFTNAWFQLGKVLEKQNEKTAAHAAYTRATNIDSKYLPPYLSLSYFAYDAQDWPELLNLTGHILALDPLNYARVKGYILDLDSFDYAEAYYYNAMANFHLGKLEAAEKSGLKAAYLDVRPRFPQLHLLLANIFINEHDNARAATELQTYLDLVPHDSNAEELREQMTKLQQPAAAPSVSEPVRE